MITAVDTSVLIAITKAEPNALAWTDLLAGAQADSDLVVCDVVAAECFALLIDRTPAPAIGARRAAPAATFDRRFVRAAYTVGRRFPGGT